MAQTDAAKLKDVSAAIREGFEEQSIMNGIKSVLQGNSPPSRNPDPLSQEKGAGPGVIGRFDSMTYQPGEVKSTQKLVDDLTSDLKNANHEIKSLAVGAGGSQDGPNAEGGKGKGGQGAEGQGEEAGPDGVKEANVPIRQIEVAVQERGIRISFDSRLLFGAGEATLQPYAYKFLDKVATRLKKFDNRRIHIEGHSDNLPISSSQFPSNWELSCARSSSVVRFFIGRHQFNPAALVAVGYGDTQPISNNATAEGRARNRRVDIIIYNEKMSSVLNPRVQFLTEQSIVKSESDGPDKPKTVLPVLPEKPSDQPADGPVRVIIKDRDGTEKILIPKTKAAEPNAKPTSGPVSVESAPAKAHKH
jgi:chemotaxis protein MotB